MAQMNFTEYHQLEAFYSEKVLNIAKDLNKKSIVWQGKLKFKLKKIIQTLLIQYFIIIKDVYDNGVKVNKSNN